jgi:hypothetical protein
LFRALSISGREVVAVGPAYTRVAFEIDVTPLIMGSSDAMILRLAL